MWLVSWLAGKTVDPSTMADPCLWASVKLVCGDRNDMQHESGGHCLDHSDAAELAVISSRELTPQSVGCLVSEHLA